MKPLFLDFTDPAEAEMSEAIEFVRFSGGNGVAERFAERVAEVFAKEVERLAEEITANQTGKPFDLPDEAASIRYAKPVYRLRIETATNRRRGSSTGLWYAYFALLDAQHTGKPDTMQIVTFRHSAGRPIGTDGDVGE